MRDAMRQRVGFSRAGARDHKQWCSNAAVTMLDGRPLLGIQRGQIVVGKGRQLRRIMEGQVHDPE